jgi:hypothetical protein
MGGPMTSMGEPMTSMTPIGGNATPTYRNMFTLAQMAVKLEEKGRPL